MMGHATSESLAAWLTTGRSIGPAWGMNLKLKSDPEAARYASRAICPLRSRAPLLVLRICRARREHEAKSGCRAEGGEQDPKPGGISMIPV
jgi:hypothetical protein